MRLSAQRTIAGAIPCGNKSHSPHRVKLPGHVRNPLVSPEISSIFFSIQRNDTCWGEKRNQNFENLIGEQLKSVMVQSRECLYEERNSIFYDSSIKDITLKIRVICIEGDDNKSKETSRRNVKNAPNQRQGIQWLLMYTKLRIRKLDSMLQKRGVLLHLWAWWFKKRPSKLEIQFG